MHTSTSPQYAIIASCDVAAAMMEPPGGTALVEESIIEALDFRRAMRKVDDEWGKDWWFKVWGPERLAPEGIGKRDDWMLRANEKWHGFGNLAPGFNMLDPIKATVITPGLDVSGKFAKTGIPASIVTKYLAEHGVIVEKTGLYSFFIMFTIGITKGRWNTLVTALQQFKDDYDKNQPLWRILPEFCAQAAAYERVGLRDLCQQIHDIYKANDVARLTTEMYLSDMEPAMKPSDAFARMAHREIDRVEIDDLEGRVTSVLLTPYPPGIPLLIPGRALQPHDRRVPAVRAELQRAFPGLRHRHPRPGRGAATARGALLRRLRAPEVACRQLDAPVTRAVADALSCESAARGALARQAVAAASSGIRRRRAPCRPRAVATSSRAIDRARTRRPWWRRRAIAPIASSDAAALQHLAHRRLEVAQVAASRPRRAARALPAPAGRAPARRRS